MEASIYHLDGPGAIQHLDSLLSIDELPAIQWVHGAGNGPMARWIPLLKRIQEAGKGVVCRCAIEEVPEMMRELSSKGLYMTTSARTEDEARECLRKMKDWTHD